MYTAIVFWQKSQRWQGGIFSSRELAEEAAIQYGTWENDNGEPELLMRVAEWELDVDGGVICEWESTDGKVFSKRVLDGVGVENQGN